jgi:2-phospho-L-lactate/phosphoenolpyruvate guanylyltransferase
VTTPDGTAPSPRVVAIVPVGVLEGAKSRLGEVLDAEERRDLVTRMVRTTVGAAVRTHGVAETIVVTPDDEARTLALEAGARPLRQRGQGLNEGLREARAEAIAGGADAILVLPVDVIEATPPAIRAILRPLEQGMPVVVLVPDRHGRGTNALLVAPPDAIDFAFGGDSRAAHRAAAAAGGVRYEEVAGPLSLDVDTPEDLLLVEERLLASDHAG